MSRYAKYAVVAVLFLGIISAFWSLYPSSQPVNPPLLVSILSIYVSILSVVVTSPTVSSIKIAHRRLTLRHGQHTLQVIAYNSGDEPGGIQIDQITEINTNETIPYANKWVTIEPHRHLEMDIPVSPNQTIDHILIQYRTMKRGKESKTRLQKVRIQKEK